ncbi:MAG: acyl carrier protein [Candidatus Midichloriaceae bacterium]|jgi:acyl carrier protein
MSDSIESRVLKVMDKKFEKDTSNLDLDTSITEDLGVDSLDIVEFIMALEEEFDTDIPDEDAEKLKTIKDVIDYISSRVS